MSKFSIFGPLLLVVGGSLVYHVAAKSVPKALEPFGALTGVYATALIASFVAYAIARGGTMPAVSGLWHPTVAAVGIGALMIELGFLLTYRAAWPASSSACSESFCCSTEHERPAADYLISMTSSSMVFPVSLTSLCIAPGGIGSCQ